MCMPFNGYRRRHHHRYFMKLFSAYDLVSGNVELVAWLPGQPDTLILNIGQKGTCGDLKSIIPILTCPIKKNGKCNNFCSFCYFFNIF